MEDNMLIELDDWHENHANAAAQQGWQLFETGFFGSARLEIHHIEDQPNSVDEASINTAFPDEDAVQSFRKSFEMREDHALLAFRLIKTHSPKEYEHWGMEKWVRALA